MIYLSWVNGDWRYHKSGLVQAYFREGMVEIPVGKCRRGTFYLYRVGEDGWKIAPLRYPKNRPEAYDPEGRIYDFLYIYGAPAEVNDALAKI